MMAAAMEGQLVETPAIAVRESEDPNKDCPPARRLTQPSPDGHQGIGSGLAAATQDCHRAIAGAI